MILKEAGASVVSLPSNEIYAAMQTGAMDAAMTSSTSFISFRLEEVAKVARLARLDLSQEKIDQYAAQLGGILGYMDKLSELDTSSVEPMYTPVEHVNVLREDVVKKDCTRADILTNAPETDGVFFIVPRIV